MRQNRVHLLMLVNFIGDTFGPRETMGEGGS